MLHRHLDLRHIHQSPLSAAEKGIPDKVEPFRLEDIGSFSFHILNEDMPLPLAVIKESALKNNSRWMRDYLRETGARIAPHGKTTMAPQLFDLQLRDGAWGVTASTVNHVAAYRKVGVERIIMANQLVGRRNIDMILNELARSPEFDFYCLIDSSKGLDLLLSAIERNNPNRPLQLLLEIGAMGGRTGIRKAEDAIALAARIKEAEPLVCLRGIEAFEGIFDLSVENSAGAVDDLLIKTANVARHCDNEGYFAESEIILTAGGSAYFDSVVRCFKELSLSRPFATVLRSGCYLTHDSGFYTRAFKRICARDSHASAMNKHLIPALEVCAYIQSLPEPGLAIVTLGRRDASFDMGLPKPLWHYRPGTNEKPLLLGDEFQTTALNDQHAYLKIPDNADLSVGDLLGFGISHPCTTFDKWKYLFVVNDDYTVVDAIKTFF